MSIAHVRRDGEYVRGRFGTERLEQTNSYSANLGRRVRVARCCGCDEPHDFVIDRDGNDVTHLECLKEDPDKPNAGDLLKPGMVIETNYGTGPYLIHRVSPWTYYGHYRAWSLTLIYQDRETGEFPDKPRDFGTINEIVVDWSSGQPRFDKLFKRNEDVVRIIGEAHRVDRRGQGVLL